MSKLTSYLFVIIVGLILIQSCYTQFNDTFRTHYQEDNEILHTDTTQTQFYKLHLHNGDVAVLKTWENSTEDSIVGTGLLYDFRRDVKRFDRI